jgi:hypothetical protein
MSHAGAGRVRSRSQSRAAAATLTTRDPDSESEPDADSDSELAAQDPCSDSGSETGSGPPHSGRVVHICVGCGKSFGSDSSLRRHRNSRWMTDPACRGSCTFFLKFLGIPKFVPKFRPFRSQISFPNCNLVFFTSEVDSELPIALRKIIFKRVEGRFQLDP